MTYSPTFTTAQAVAVEVALEARLTALGTLRDELLRQRRDPFLGVAVVESSIASVEDTIATTSAALAVCKLTPANSPALSAMLTAERNAR